MNELVAIAMSTVHSSLQCEFSALGISCCCWCYCYVCGLSDVVAGVVVLLLVVLVLLFVK